MCKYFYENANNFSSDENANNNLEKILSVTGISKTFTLMRCDAVPNVSAITSRTGIRYIMYNKIWLDKTINNKDDFHNLSILAHEIGHHVNGHTLHTSKHNVRDILEKIIRFGEQSLTENELEFLKQRRFYEIQADEYSGFVMYNLGASLEEAQNVINLISTNENDKYSTHPNKNKRLNAIKKGYENAKNNSSNIDAETNLADVNFYKGLEYNSKNKYVEAISSYSKAIEIVPSKYEYHLHRGKAYHNDLNFELALNDFDISIKINPEIAEAYNYRASTQIMKNNYDLALKDCDTAIKLNTIYTEAYFNRSRINEIYGNYEKVISDLSIAINYDSLNYTYYIKRGNAYNELREFDLAQKDFTKCIKLDSNNYEGYLHRGNIYYNQRQYSSAYEDLTFSIELNSFNINAFKIRAEVSRKLKQSFCEDYNNCCLLGDEECCEISLRCK
ncbi:MAG: Uncharacterised protein [Cryomorphaceae bacterium]|nr:MAG: Uncharacterised protein [Cryomorphaceae bacterium]